MDFLPTLFSFPVSGCVAAAFLGLMFTGLLDTAANALRRPQRFAAVPARREGSI
jgi:hypothetical protein